MGLQDRDYYRPRGFRGFYLLPPVIKNILVINIVVFLIQFIFENLRFGGYPGWYLLNRYFALNPLLGIDPAGQPYNFQIWQLLTYQFMHGGFWHIFFNMLMLWMFGMEIENLWGSRKFLIYYLSCGIGGGIAQLLFSPLVSNYAAYTIGASASVFGVMVAFGMTFPDRYIFLLFPPIPMKAKYLIGFLILIEYLSVGNPGEPVAHLAHLGGAAVGFLFILYYRKHGYHTSGLSDFFKKAFGRRKPKIRVNEPFRRPSRREEDSVIDADFYELDENEEYEIDQEELDRILDKISQGGYQSLTEREKRILFEASKRK
jgi:membrane associated rhomboid family serine protease